jgi:H+/Cl- antiporter ClcA
MSMKSSEYLHKVYSRGSLDRLFIKAPYIVAGIVAGLVSVGFGLSIDRLTEFTAHVLTRYPWLFLIITPLAFVSSRWMVQAWAPTAAGSGIPQVMASLDLRTATREHVPHLLNMRVLIVKILSCSLCLLGGGIVGREGPMVQIGAILFLSIGSLFKRFMNRVDDYSLIVAGGAAGVAAAFNTPLGGIVFAIEELINEHFSKVRSALIVGVIIAGMVAQLCLGPYLYFEAVQIRVPGSSFLLPALIISLATGIMGGLFGKVLINTQQWLGSWSGARRLQWAALCGLLVALGLIVMKDSAPYAVGGGTQLIRDILWNSETVHLDLVLQRFLATLITFISGCAGGIFAPSLAMGAAFAKSLQPFFTNFDPVNLTLVGMVGFLAAVTRAPFTAMVLVTEMTDGHGLALYVLLASLFAVGVSRVVEPRSYYHFQSQVYLKTFGSKAQAVPVDPAVSQHY